MKYIVALVLAMLFPVTLLAQASEGSVLGVVVDPSGAALAGANVTVKNTLTNAARLTVTNKTGEYVVSNLPVGTYSVTAEITGFRTSVNESIELTVKARVRVDFTMQAGMVNQSVEVSSSAPLLKTDTVEVSTLITRKELEALPSLDRNFLSLQVLTSRNAAPLAERRRRSHRRFLGWRVNAGEWLECRPEQLHSGWHLE